MCSSVLDRYDLNYWIYYSASHFLICTAINNLYQLLFLTIPSISIGHLSFISIIAFFSKTLRVRLLVNTSLKKRKITSYQTLLFAGFWSGLMIVYMAIVTPLNTPHVASSRTVSGNSVFTYQYYCQTNQSILDWVLYAYELLFMLLAMKVCHDTMNVPDAINEAPYIAKVVFSIISITIIVFSVVYGAGDLAEYVKKLIVSIGYFLYIFALVYYYFGYKCYLLLMGATFNSQFQVVIPTKKGVAVSDIDRSTMGNTSFNTTPPITMIDKIKSAHMMKLSSNFKTNGGSIKGIPLNEKFKDVEIKVRRIKVRHVIKN